PFMLGQRLNQPLPLIPRTAKKWSLVGSKIVFPMEAPWKRGFPIPKMVVKHGKIANCPFRYVKAVSHNEYRTSGSVMQPMEAAYTSRHWLPMLRQSRTHKINKGLLLPFLKMEVSAGGSLNM